MTGLLADLRHIWKDEIKPFLITPKGTLSFSEIESVSMGDINKIGPGTVVALIGDFDSISVRTLLELLDRGAIVVPLTMDTALSHEYFFRITKPAFVIRGTEVVERPKVQEQNPVLEEFRSLENPGLILFTSGTTGEPKAILHDFTIFIDRFRTPRPAWRTLSFLLFDHIGGLNTLFHTLYNRGLVVSAPSRDIRSVFDTCEYFEVQLLPTTPTFLRMAMLSGYPQDPPKSLQLITYGTELMPESTLVAISQQFSSIDFRQTYGMSELGILRVRSQSRDSTWMQIGGDGVETRVVEGELHIRSRRRMFGYLNAPSPFAHDDWYHTGDLVVQDGEWLRIVGRMSDVLNVGGLKFSRKEIEEVALRYPGVEFAKAIPKANPLTGQHCELEISVLSGKSVDLFELKEYLKHNLEPHKRPLRIGVSHIRVSHRFKQA